MRKKLISFLLSVTLVPSTAFANDWSGFYAGVHGGYGWSDTSPSLEGTDPFGILLADAIRAAGGATHLSADGDGFLGGIQAGFNFQTGTFVWGIEADISRGQLDGSGTDVIDAGGGQTLASVARSDLEWLGTVRARAGTLLTPDTLVYVTGGLAYGRVSQSWSSTLTGLANPIIAGGDSSWEAGWTIGGGAEFKLSNGISLRGEYLYYDLGSSSSSAQLDPAIGIVGGTFDVRSDNTGHVVRAALNFQFGSNF